MQVSDSITPCTMASTLIPRLIIHCVLAPTLTDRLTAVGRRENIVERIEGRPEVAEAEIKRRRVDGAQFGVSLRRP